MNGRVDAPDSRADLKGDTCGSDHLGRGGEPAPLIAHIVHSLEVGGLQNGLINLINRLPVQSYQHAVISLTGTTNMASRFLDPATRVYTLDKRSGQDFRIHLELYRLFRRIKPDVVHTRNLSTLEAQLAALLAGVPHRVHGEHGRDISDLDGARRRYQWLRRALEPIVHRYIAVSQDLERYLECEVGIPRRKIIAIRNGVDTSKFAPGDNCRDRFPDGFCAWDSVVVGTVGRMEAVKDQITLVRAFVRLVQGGAGRYEHVRLVAIGDGTLRAPAQRLLEEAGMTDVAWLPGERDDVPELLRAMDIFVLPSLAEGISNTILEAMASGLPVVATDVGGNSELVATGKTGILVPRADPYAMAEAIRSYVDDPLLRREDGARGRQRCEREFSIDAMVERYATLYDSLLEAGRSGAHPSRVVDAG